MTALFSRAWTVYKVDSTKMPGFTRFLAVAVVLFSIGTNNKAVLAEIEEPNLDRFVGWDDYFREWKVKASLMAQRMYPFSPAYGDQRRYDEGISLSFGDAGIPFYAVTYKSFYVSQHAFLEFSELPNAPRAEYNPRIWPNELYPEPQQKDPPLAAVFYARHEYGDRGSLHYRVMTRSNGPSTRERIDLGQLDQLSDHVRAAVVGADSFSATHGALVTWENVTFSGVCCTGDGPDRWPRNTYQVALISDQKDTFVILNFYKISWAGDTSMGCDANTGRTSDSSPKCEGAQIGFNVGGGRHFWPHPYSRSTTVLEMDKPERRGSDVNGRFFYKVSDAFILRGGCTDDTKIAGPRWPLAIAPNMGGMFGGYDVNISAPCLSSGDRLQCRFGDVVTEGVFNERDIMKARCPAPMMTSVGRVKVAVSIDGGRGYLFDNIITVGIIGYVPPGVQIENPNHDWLNVDRLKLTWDPNAISWRTVQEVDIVLYGYREDGETSASELRLLKTLATSIRNDGYWTIATSSHQCGGGMDAARDCTRYMVGLLMVSVAHSDPGASPITLWSSPFPLGWFVRTEAPKHLGNNWMHEICRRWYSDDVKTERWDEGLAVCPCTLTQAKADWGRFPMDIDCNLLNTGKATNCRRHKGAVHCVRSTHYTGKGAGSHCCYDSSGNLMYSGDNQYGSTPDRAHSWGMPPYGKGPYLPTVSHWHWDVAPFYACCAWQTDDSDCFTYYISRRITATCKTYLPPAHAAAFGDPHIRTFDGAVYTYNGKGEYWLLLMDPVKVGPTEVTFALQARFERPKPLSWGTPNATVISAVVMTESPDRSTEGDIVEMQRNNYDPGDRLLLVYVNGALIDFRDPDLWRQDFKDVIIMNNDPTDAKVHGNFTVVFRASGVGIQVAHKGGLIHIITVVPPEFKFRTQGLFGYWDGNAGNDIRPRGGGQGVPASDTSRIHNVVGHTWQIVQSESRFTYWAKLNLDYYSDKNYVPEMSPKFPENSGGVTPDQVRTLCGTNTPCQYDYMVTLLEKVAKDTLSIQAWVQEQSRFAQPVVTCGWLSIPFAIKRQPVLNSPGSVITIEGCRHNYQLQGNTVYRCVSTGDTAEWQPTINTRCVDMSEVKQDEVRMAVAIGVPAGIVFLLIVILIIAILCYCRQKRIDRGPKKDPPDDLMHIPVSNFHASDIRPGDEFVKPTKRPRPVKQSANPISRSNDDLSLYGTNRTQTKVPLSASLDNLDNRDVSLSTLGRDEVDQNVSSQSGASSQKPLRPYQYPRNAETAQEKRRAPYHYPRNTDLTPEERALIELRSRQYSTDSQ